MARVINSKAKKYANLRKKQAEANRYLKQAKNSLTSGEVDDAYVERAYYAAQDRLRRFQLSHKLDKKRTFSMQGIKTDEVKLYEQLLDSVIENVSLNPKRQAAHKQSQINYYIEQGWADNEVQGEQVYSFTRSGLFDELKSMGLEDVPSQLVEKYSEYVDSDFTEDDFILMTKVYAKQRYSQGTDVSDFFEFADNFLGYMETRDDIYKASNEYLETFEEIAFDKFLEKF